MRMLWGIRKLFFFRDVYPGSQADYSDNTSAGRKFAPVEGLSHDLVCTGSIYHVHFAWQVWHGQLSPRFKFNKLKSFSGVEIDQNHVDKRILEGKGFAVGRLKRHNFCPASVVLNFGWLRFSTKKMVFGCLWWKPIFSWSSDFRGLEKMHRG